MHIKTWVGFCFVLTSLTFLSLGHAGPLCRIFLSSENTTAAESPQNNLLSQLQIRFLKVEQGLQTSGPQTQRQVQKLMGRLEELVNEFVKKGDLSEKDMERLMKYSAEIDVFERRFAELIDINLIPPTELHRYLFTEEPLFPQLTYSAQLPELGPVRIHFSKEVADIFNQIESVYRKNLFPLVFRGLVGRQGQDGIKAFSGGKHGIEKEVNGVMYQLMELKKIGVEDRIIIVSTSTGELYFYKHLSNHHRIEYIAKEGILQNFFNNVLNLNDN